MFFAFLILAGVCAARAQPVSELLSGYARQPAPSVPLAAAPDYFAPPESFAFPERVKTAEKKPNVSPCKVLDFKIILEGWSRPGEIGDNTPCSLVAIPTQASCPEGPCYNIACSALIHYSATRTRIIFT